MSLTRGTRPNLGSQENVIKEGVSELSSENDWTPPEGDTMAVARGINNL